MSSWSGKCGDATPGMQKSYILLGLPRSTTVLLLPIGLTMKGNRKRGDGGAKA